MQKYIHPNSKKNIGVYLTILTCTIVTAQFLGFGGLSMLNIAEAQVTNFTTDITSKILHILPFKIFKKNDLYNQKNISQNKNNFLGSAIIGIDSVIATNDNISVSSIIQNTDESVYIDESKLLAKSVMIKNLTTGKIIYSKNPDEQLPLASLVKLMTAITVRNLQENWQIFPTQIQLSGDGTPLTKADFSIGSEGFMKIDDMLNYMLLTSSNFAAQSLARNIIPEMSFISYMNFTAKKIGLAHSTFINASGLTETLHKNNQPLSSVGTVRDVTILLEKIIIEYPELASATQIQSATVTNTTGKKIEIKNTNKLLDDPLFSTQKKRIVLGKTGFTDEAGGNLAIVLLKNNQYYSITVIGSTIEGRFDDIHYLATQI